MPASHLSVRQRLTRLAIGVVSTAAVATGAYAFSPVTAAQAATIHSGCTMTPSAPTASNIVDQYGQKLVNYRGTVICTSPIGKTVEIQRERWEEDPGNDDYSGYTTSTFSASFAVWWDQKALLDTDGTTSEYEQPYQRVRFRVTAVGLLTTTADDVTSPWSVFEVTNATSIHQ